MKNQYILLATAIIIGLLYFFYLFPTQEKSLLNPKALGENFENEIYYISSKFDKKFIGNFTKLFEKYASNLTYNFEYICISPINLSLSDCSSTTKNCCYYFNKSFSFNLSILKYCNKTGILYEYNQIICFCYRISKEDKEYINFFCT